MILLPHYFCYDISNPRQSYKQYCKNEKWHFFFNLIISLDYIIGPNNKLLDKKIQLEETLLNRIVNLFFSEIDPTVIVG